MPRTISTPSVRSVSLVADIGGTNTRLGLVAPGRREAANIESQRNEEAASLEALIASYLARHGSPVLAAAALAIAGPVRGESLALTNRGWSFTRPGLRRALGIERLLVLNDFEAHAEALPWLSAAALAEVRPGRADPRGLKLVLGPGTGFGMAALAPVGDDDWQPIAGELGHASLPVASEVELRLAKGFAEAAGHVPIENPLSGPGLERLYRLLAGQSGSTAAPPSSESLVAAALAGSDPVAVRALHQFATWLGRVCGDAALSLGAFGGVYLGGGIAPAILPVLRSPAFLEPFAAKGRMSRAIADVPVAVITDPTPALVGAAAALIRRR